MGWLHPSTHFEAHFGDRVIRCFSERPKSLHALLEGAVARNGAGEALVCGEVRLTWQELSEAAARLAQGLSQRGVAPGERVALLLGNRLEFVVALFAIARLGAVIVPLSVRLQTPELAYVLDHCGAELLIHDAEFGSRLPTSSAMRRVAVGACAGSEEYAALLQDGSRSEAAAVREEDAAAILYTSGTTGRPKGAVLTHLNVVHSAMVYEHCMSLTAADRSIAAVPLSHVTGLIANLAALARSGGAVIILPTFKASEFLDLAAREGITHTIIVPAMYNLLLLQSDFDAHDLSSWRIGGFGGAPMTAATIERLAEKLPNLRLMNAYGATETTSPTTLMPPWLTASHLDSVGQPVPCAQVIAVDDKGAEVPPGESGELWIQGPSVAKGYWNDPPATIEAFTGGFWHSGDIGSVDAEGFVRVLDRKKDMINRGGLKIYSAEVESVLSEHAGVIEAAIVGRSCPVLGERVHAFVTSREPLDAEELRRFCHQRLADYKVPETLTVQREALPRNANGKVMKRTLRDAL